MPRRNSATLSTTRKMPATHVVVCPLGKIVFHGRKAECHEVAESNNSLVNAWAYRVRPIHK